MWAWKRYWLGLPEHIRKGLLRLYIAVAVPWVAYFAYQIYDAIHRSRYVSHEQEAVRAFWWLLLFPVIAPILFVVISWVLAGFRKSTAGPRESGFGSGQPSAEASNPLLRDKARKSVRRASSYFIWTIAICLVSSFIMFVVEASAKDNVARAVGFFLGRVAYNDWLWILFLLNGLALRRYQSRVAAGLFVLVGLFGASGMLFALISFNVPAGSRYIPVSAALYFATYILVGVWALVATIKLHKQSGIDSAQNDPGLRVATPRPSRST
jgi:hypothetical protein